MGRNRDKRLQAKSDKMYWCYYCDHELVSEGEKCEYCGKKDRHAKLRFKKLAPMIDEEWN